LRNRFTTAVLLLSSSVCGWAATPAATLPLPDAPSAILLAQPEASTEAVSSSAHFFDSADTALQAPASTPGPNVVQGQQPGVEYDANGNPIPLNRRQPKRILGFMPNFRSVSAGAVVHKPGWKYNFEISTKQSFDWSSFLFLGLTTVTAEGIDEHPALGKGINGFWNYGWRGFLDKTDGTYLQGWFLPSLLHEDTRYYPLGAGHPIVVRALYVISRQAVTRTYGGRQTPNIAGLGGKVLTQIISRQYYPPGSSDFGVLAEKFGYAAMRDVAFTSIREFYPDIAAHYVKKHHEKQARVAAQKAAEDATSSGVKP
jgi:hypothetical protein